MPENDIDAEIRRTRACDALSAIRWCEQQHAEVEFFASGSVEVKAQHGAVYGSGPSFVAAVLAAVLPSAKEGAAA